MRKAGQILGYGALGAGGLTAAAALAHHLVSSAGLPQQAALAFPSDNRQMVDVEGQLKQQLAGAPDVQTRMQLENQALQAVFQPASQDRLLWQSDAYERNGTKMARKDYIPSGQSDTVVSETLLPETGEVVVQEIPLRYYAAHVGVPGSGGDYVQPGYTAEQVRADHAAIRQVSGPPADQIPGIAWGS